MLSNQEKLLELNKSIQRELRREIEQIDRDIAQYREDQLQAVEDEAVADSYRYIQTSTAKIKLYYTTERSHALAELRRQLLLKRDEYVELIFREVREQLLAFTGQEGYPAFLRRKFAAVSGAYHLKCPIVSLCGRDMKYAPLFLEIVPQAQVQESRDILIGGFTAEKSGETFILNETLDNTLMEQREWFYSHSGLRIPQI